MRIRYGKYIFTRPSAVIAELARKDLLIADAEARRVELAAYADSILARHQPYWLGSHNGGLDLATTENGELAAGVVEKLGKNLWCTHCRNPWPCRMVEPLRVLTKELRWPSDGALPEPLPAPTNEHLIKVAL